MASGCLADFRRGISFTFLEARDMPRILGRGLWAVCPDCGAPLRSGDIGARPFRCPRCSAWLRVPYLRLQLPGWVGAALSAAIALELGLRGVSFILGLLVGSLVLAWPAYELLCRFWPMKPRSASPDFLTLDLRDAAHSKPSGKDAETRRH